MDSNSVCHISETLIARTIGSPGNLVCIPAGVSVSSLLLIVIYALVVLALLMLARAVDS